MRVPNEAFGWTKATIVPREPGRGDLVDHPGAAGLHRLERLGAVIDAIGDVVEPFAVLRQVLGHR